MSLWAATPFHPNACVRGAGADCLRMVIAIYNECGHPVAPELPAYGMHDGRCRADEGPILPWLHNSPLFCQSWDKNDTPKTMPGDLLCFRIGKSVHHLGIVADGREFFHAVKNYGAIYSLMADSTYRARLAAVFTPL